MAVAGDLAVAFTRAIAGNSTTLDSKNWVCGAPLGSLCNNGVKVKRKASGGGVSATLQVGFEPKEGLRKNVEGALGFDVVSESELREKGFLGMSKTKLVCTIGPACSSMEDLEKLALGGMNVARLNMCHNTRDWHLDVIRKIKKLNEEKGFCVSVMMDTEGSQIHVVDHGAPSSVKVEVSQLKLPVRVSVSVHFMLLCRVFGLFVQ
ncbi:hypothetical protein CRG98_050108 [Punica granatum]|uniref:pyruvate kinase n=1 Tax=Punica granatum TaxID=22663 RepID=A0A2I0GT29_PUNGR|nr:hypothetical protein CRG98_050108 [Punica granatum]